MLNGKTNFTVKETLVSPMAADIEEFATTSMSSQDNVLNIKNYFD